MTLELLQKNAMVVGLGESGLAVVRFLRERGARVLVNDQRDREALGAAATQAEALGAELVLGGHPDSAFEDLDLLDQIIANHITYEFNTLKITDQFMEIFGWLELQDINVIIILSLMVLVSGINMISALLVIILERTNMIGLLKSMGAHNASIGRIFLLNATYLILIGLLIGNVLGLGLGWLQQEFELIKLDQANYYVDHVPVLFQAQTILLINIGSMIACLVMLILPSMIVSRIDPVKTIKFN